MNDTQRQILLEQEATKLGRERYFSTQQESTKRGREFEGGVANKIIAAAMKDLLPAMRKFRREQRAKLIRAQTTGERVGGWEMFVESIDSETAAYVTIKTALVASAHDYRVQRLATIIGLRLNEEMRWRRLQKEEATLAKEREYDPPNRVQMMRKRVKQINPKSVKKWLKKLDDIETDVWSKKLQFTIGTHYLKLLLDVCPDLVDKTSVMRPYGNSFRTFVIVRPTEKLTLSLNQKHDHAALLTPWLLPTVCPPQEWGISKYGDVSGGYINIPQPILKTVRFSHGTDDVSTVSKEVVTALNKVQSTGWKINNRVLQIATEAREHSVGPLPVEPLMPMMKSVPAEDWAQMSKAGRGSIKSQREAIHTHNNRQQARGLAVERVINTANKFAEEPAIYFPHNLDWRGRAYPLPQDIHPQSDDFAKSMLTFSEGKPLGKNGLKWLVFHLANCYGMDKLDRAGQADWYNDHMGDIYRVASDPFHQGLEFWAAADEPWQFLAACVEVCLVGDDPTYVSHLPVQVDGSCNGLQHLSAMGLDPIGAKAVNLMPGPREDIYQIVADKVRDVVAVDIDDYTSGKMEVAKAWWYGGITRKTVKRGVMTTPYGLTAIGMRDQLIKDRWVDDIEGDRMENANYLRDRMKEAINDTIVKGTEIMAWFQDCAEILAKGEKGISWTTPIGLRVTQRYTVKSTTRIHTLLGQLDFEEEDNGDEKILERKQKLSIAPNIIHSFDGAHMMLSVLAAPDDFSFSVIHDSFGCHAADMEEFGHVIREQFVEIYKTDWFFNMQHDFRLQGAKYLTDAPERGDFDISNVLDAEFFFA